jgi:hypothetical protein
MKHLREVIDALLDAIDDAADGTSWLDHGPYQLILQRAKELRKVAQKEIGGLKESYEPKV